MGNILLFGYGNTLRGDDGVGPEAVSRLEHRLAAEQLAVECRVAHQLLPEDAEAISETDTVIFIDAREGKAPGVIDVRKISPDQRPAGGKNYHLITPSVLLWLAGECFGHAPDAYLYTLSGTCFGYRQGLSPAVEAALPEFMEQILGKTEQLKAAS